MIEGLAFRSVWHPARLELLQLRSMRLQHCLKYLVFIWRCVVRALLSTFLIILGAQMAT